jgi:hypothetical protein
MSDPIRAALEKAWLESPSFLVTLPSGNRRTSLSTVETAEIIAAFLRALPDQYTQGGAAFWDAIPTHDETRLWLADAVLAAAKDQAND